MTTKFKNVILLLMLVSSSMFSQTFTGELRKWHDITLNVELPANNLNENANTFMNHRMDVVFTDPSGGTIRVPGFFAGDGNAANTSATSGKVFKAHLRPYATGAWKYKILYYTGTDVAIQAVNALPSPTQELNGDVGNILPNNKALPDLRAKGRLQYQSTGTNNQKRYLRFPDTGEYFLKWGPDSPENLLDYAEFDFDDNRNNCNLCRIHNFNPHASDYNNDGPTWDGGKGKNIMGALNYIRDQKMNAISMSLFGGDDKNVFPWTKVNSKFIFDVSKLAQWALVLDHAEKNNLFLHFKLAEAENWNALNSRQIKVYYREMIARFGHHLAMEWNISEEYGGKDGGTPQSAIERINFLADNDPWQNLRVIHTYPNRHRFFYNGFLNLNARINGASVQSAAKNNYKDAYDGDSGILTWIDASRNDGSQWVVSSDEQNSGKTGIFTSELIGNKNVKKEARTRILWSTLVAGGAGVMWYGGSQGDFQTENFDRFSTLFEWTRYAFVDFFKKYNIEYWNSVNRDNLVSGDAKCLANVGTSYVIYLETGGSTQLNLGGQTGSFKVEWFDPRNGGNLISGNTINAGGNVSIGNPPASTAQDWVAIVTRNGADQNPDNPIDDNCEGKVFIEENGVVAIEAEDFTSQELVNDREWFVFDASTSGTPTPDPDNNHAAGASGGKYIELLPDTRVTHGDPLTPQSFQANPGNAGIINYKVKFSSGGKYFVWVRAYSTGSEDNGIHVGINGTWPASGARMQWCAGKNAWTWESKQRTAANHCGEPQKIFLDVPSAGEHTISFSMREDGFEMDKIILSKAYVKPTSEGVNSSTEGCSDDDSDNNTGNDDVALNNPKTTFDLSGSYTIPVAYEASESRDVVVAFYAADNTWLANGIVTVPSGIGTTNVTVSNFATPPPAGTGYIYRAFIRPVGSGFADNLDSAVVENVTLEEAQQFNDTVSFATPSTSFDLSGSYTVTVDYEASESRDIGVAFFSPTNQWLGAAISTVSVGQGQVDITVNFATPPTAGTGFAYRTFIRPVGGTFNEDIAEQRVENVTMEDAVPLVDAIAVNSPLTEFDLSGSYTVTVDYTAAEDRDVLVAFFSSTNQWLGAGKVTVSAGSGTLDITANLATPPAASTGNFYRAIIREVGGGFDTNKDLVEISNVSFVGDSGFIVTPQNGANVPLGQSVSVTLDTSSITGSITKHEVYVNGSKKDTDGANYTPHSFTPTTAGTYVIKVDLTVDGVIVSEEVSITAGAGAKDLLISSSPEVSVYPNPIGTSPTVTVSLENSKATSATLQVFSLEGTLLIDKEYSQLDVNSGSLTLDVSTLISGGVYILRISDANGFEQLEKLVK